ncbi:MAG TPA: PEP-CTERM sorting domain-containing protein [Cellvibrio sp.]
MKNLLAGLLTLVLSFSLNANAINIDLIADHAAINIGENVELQVRISGLDGELALGAYDVNFNYDASLFSINTIIWGDSQGNQLDLSGSGSLQDTSNGIGWLNLFALSFDDVLTLELLQESEFTLFSVLLNAIAIGSGDFSLTANTLGDASGNDLFLDSINGVNINVNGASVPEPSSLLLLIGVLAMLVLRTKLPHSPT